MHGLISQVTSVLIIDVSDPVFVCCSDREYPRLGQMIVDYENPLKKMMEEFVPHGKVEVCLCSVMRQHFDFCLPPSPL